MAKTTAISCGTGFTILYPRFYYDFLLFFFWFDSIRFVPCALISIKLCVIRSVIRSFIRSYRHSFRHSTRSAVWITVPALGLLSYPWSRWESLCALSQCQHNEKLFCFFFLLFFCTFILQFLLLHFGLHLEALSDIDSPRIALNQTESHWILRH